MKVIQESTNERRRTKSTTRSIDFRTEVDAMNIRNSKESKIGVDNMRRRKLRGDLTVNNEYRSNRNIND